MKHLTEWFHKGNLPTDSITGVPGAGSNIRLLLALMVCMLVVVGMLYLLDARAADDGSVIDARALQAVELTPQIDRVFLPLKPVEQTESMRRTMQVSITLMVIADRAGTVTASVGMFDNRVNRIIAAGNAASNVVRFAQVSEELAPGSEVAETLRDLALALSTYDIDRVRSTSFRLAELQQQLIKATHESQLMTNAPAILKFE